MNPKAVAIVIVYSLFHYLSQTVVDSTGKQHYEIENKDTLYDLSQFLPNFSDYSEISHIFTASTGLPLLATMNIKIITEFIGLFITVSFVRDILMNTTILPKIEGVPDNHSLFGGAYDKMFSNHTSFVFLLTLIYYKHGIITNISVLVLTNVVNVVLILLTRSHYTMDTLVSFFVVLTVFQNNLRII